ncbi:hypothetical protein [Roseovarius aestuariivivens]|nr:hypothetical protein [Roseovarius aestuariivivens]
MLIKALSWLITPPKKTRGHAGSDDQFRGWVVLVLIVVALAL